LSFWPRRGRIPGTILTLVEQRDIIEVRAMEQPDALALFKKKLGNQSESQDIAKLAQALEFMPLAIVQAASYISDPDRQCSVQQYLEKFRKSDLKKTSLLNHEGGQLRRDPEAKNSVIITWQISFEHLREARASAADLLSLMSFFDRQGIPKALLQNRIEQGNSQQNRRGSRSDGTDDDEDSESHSSESDEFKEDIIQLRKYSFIYISADGATFEMHGLVQLATRKWLKANGQLEEWKQQFIKNLNAELPTGDYENWAKCQALFPHAKSAAAQRPEERESLTEWASVLYKAARYAWRKGEGAKGEKMLVKVMNARKKLLGQEDEETLRSMAMVGLIYSLEGRWKEAEELDIQVVETAKKVLGPEHPDTLASMGNLASTYCDQGRWKEVEELDVQVMETTKKVLGPEHPHTLVSINNLASTFLNQGRRKEAEELEVRVLETRKKVLGPEHPNTLDSMNNLAETYRDQGRWKEAKELEIQAMEIRKRLSGEEHPSTLTSMDNLALTFSKEGRWKEAEELQVKVLEIRKKVLGEEHRDTLAGIANLASTFWNQGRWKEAGELQDKALEICKRVLGEKHPDT